MTKKAQEVFDDVIYTYLHCSDERVESYTVALSHNPFGVARRLEQYAKGLSRKRKSQ